MGSCELHTDGGSRCCLSAAVSAAGVRREGVSQGTNTIYVRLQGAWDKRDLDDIRSFTSAEVFSEIRQQAEDDPVPGKTELLRINPSILEVRDTGSQIIASVLYDVLLRENEDEFTQQVRELWHFSRDRANPESFWILEGIQQVEQ